jgi:hypothetical protein
VRGERRAIAGTPFTPFFNRKCVSMSLDDDIIEAAVRPPRRTVTIRRDDRDFVVIFKPEDVIALRNSDEAALRKVCHYLRWEVVSDRPPDGDDAAGGEVSDEAYGGRDSDVFRPPLLATS